MVRYRSILFLLFAAMGNWWWLPSAMAGKQLALIVACNQSAFAKQNKLESYMTTEKDASQVRYVLSAAGYDVTLLSDTEATRTGRDQDRPSYQNIQDKLQRITTDAELDQSSSVIIVLAGLAENLQRTQGRNKPPAIGGQAGSPQTKLFFEAGDAPVKMLFDNRPSAEEITDAHKMIDIEGVWDRMSRCGASSKLMLLDVCRFELTKGGHLFGYARTLPDLPPPPDGVAVLCCCSKGENSLDEPKYLGSGVFMHHVLCGLHGSADGVLAQNKADGAVSIPELTEYVRIRVPQHLAMLYPAVKVATSETGGPRTPQLVGKCQTDVPLIEINRKPLGKKAGEVRSFPLKGAIKTNMVWCPPGKYLRGPPPGTKGENDPQLEVNLSMGFWLGQTELTQAQWKAVMDTEPWLKYADKSHYRIGANHPAVYMRHPDAVEFCRRVTELQRDAGVLPVHWEYRLPTDGEWEYACRAGTNTQWSFGDDIKMLPQYAWVEGSRNLQALFAKPVAQKRPNNWKLYDMHGNAAEWTADTDSSSLVKIAGYDPICYAVGHVSNQWRIARGGNVFSSDVRCHRGSMTEPDASPWIGLRLALCPIAH